MTDPGPPLFGRERVEQSLIELDRNTWDDRLDRFYPQASSQWDGLKHVRAREHGFYTGLTSDPGDIAGRLGIEHWASGIISRGVLLDIPRHRRERGRPYDAMAGEAITPEELLEVADAQGVIVQPGDVLCIRLGWQEAYRALSEEDRATMARPDGGLAYSGLKGAEGMSELLWDWRIAALTCDNPSIEVKPGNPADGSLHRRILPLLGMALGELFDFEQLAEACAVDKRWTFTFIGVPLRMPDGLGSPANAVAIR
jgi:kynurenine formamidase